MSPAGGSGVLKRKHAFKDEEEEEMSQSFGDKCAFLSPEVEIKPARKSSRLSSNGYATVTLLNGNNMVVEFEGKEIFTHRLHLLIEESTGLSPANTLIVKGGKILAASECVKSGSRIHLLQALKATAAITD